MRTLKEEYLAVTWQYTASDGGVWKHGAMEKTAGLLKEMLETDLLPPDQIGIHSVSFRICTNPDNLPDTNEEFMLEWDQVNHWRDEDMLGLLTNKVPSTTEQQHAEDIKKAMLHVPTDLKETGDRFNADKVILSFIDEAPAALEGCAKVLMAGAEKYSRGNWLNGLKWIEDIYDSMRRHQLALLRGEDLDPESGLPHVDHILCNALFLSHMFHTRKDLDDRINKPHYMDHFKQPSVKEIVEHHQKHRLVFTTSVKSVKDVMEKIDSFVEEWLTTEKEKPPVIFVLDKELKELFPDIYYPFQRTNAFGKFLIEFADE